MQWMDPLATECLFDNLCSLQIYARIKEVKNGIGLKEAGCINQRISRHLDRSVLQCLANADNLDTDGDYDVSNDKAGDRSSTMLSFKTSPGSACNILMTVYMSGESKEIVRCLFAFYINIVGPPPGMMVCAAVGNTARKFLIQIDERRSVHYCHLTPSGCALSSRSDKRHLATR
ncbi:hypothetical protein TNCV_1423321 [Trichonephila clavipes]|nr:hypothetical protein TNCV_1423321 [Trichonephila clavipes]